MKTQYAKKLSQIERKCKIQSMELTKQKEEIKGLKDENLHLKVELQRLEITFLKHDHFNLKAQVQHFLHKT